MIQIGGCWSLRYSVPFPNIDDNRQCLRSLEFLGHDDAAVHRISGRVFSKNGADFNIVVKESPRHAPLQGRNHSSWFSHCLFETTSRTARPMERAGCKRPGTWTHGFLEAQAISGPTAMGILRALNCAISHSRSSFAYFTSYVLPMT